MRQKYGLLVKGKDDGGNKCPRMSELKAQVPIKESSGLNSK